MTPKAENVAVEELWQKAAVRLQSVGVESPSLEAQLLVGLAFGLTRIEVLAGGPVADDPSRRQELERLIGARERRVPLAYLRGTQDFFGITFEVSRAVLIPRPETERLVELAMEKLAGLAGVMVDVGTGSGCIPVAVCAGAPEVRAIAVDISREALVVATRNAIRLGVSERVLFVNGNMLEPVGDRTADVVVSNPPYIPTREIRQLQPEVRDFEPRIALDGGRDGLSFHARLARSAPRILKPGGLLAVEVAHGQAKAVADTLRHVGYVNISLHRDLAGIDRVVAGFSPKG